MHKQFQIFACFLALCVITTSAYPALEEEIPQDEGQSLVRVRRFTCDVLSASVGGFQFNHSACALHCLKLKKSGGHCENGTCYCRK